MNIKNILFIFAVTLTSCNVTFTTPLEDAFPEEVTQMTPQEEEAIQKAIDFIEYQIISIVVQYMQVNHIQYAACAGQLYEIKGDELYIYSFDDLDEQQALWALQWDITDYVLDHLSDNIAEAQAAV